MPVCEKYVIRTISVTAIFFILLSCNTNSKSNENNSSEKLYSSYEDGESSFLTITVDVNQNDSLSLSYIADEVKEVKLETTGWPLARKKIIWSESYILLLVVEQSQKSHILLFDNNGRLINQMDSKGQGVGEFYTIKDIAADFKNKLIYVYAKSKIICYNFDGSFVNESSPIGEVGRLHFLNNKLFYFVDPIETKNVTEYKARNMIYEIHNNLEIIDSIKIRDIDLNTSNYMTLDDYNYLTCLGDEIYLSHNNFLNFLLHKPIIIDTLYILKNKSLIPHLRISYSDNNKKTEGKISILFMYRNTRFVFTKHFTVGGFGFFCYDMKEKTGYYMKDGVKDDIRTGEIVDIFPVDSDANKFYYLHTNPVDSSKNKSNLILYIGTLKK